MAESRDQHASVRADVAIQARVGESGQLMDADHPDPALVPITDTLDRIAGNCRRQVARADQGQIWLTVVAEMGPDR